MALLRMRNAAFSLGTCSAGPVTLAVRPGERTALPVGSPQEAAVIALMAAGIAKASSGCVLIGDYDPRVQSVNCKRIAGFVPHEPVSVQERDFAGYIAYRAALWKVNTRNALAYAAVLRERLADMHEAFAYPLIGALIGMPKLVVLDRPELAYAPQILAVTETRAVFSTHTNAAAAHAFGRPHALAMTRA
jgi:hypothetical protein